MATSALRERPREVKDVLGRGVVVFCPPLREGSAGLSGHGGLGLGPGSGFEPQPTRHRAVKSGSTTSEIVFLPVLKIEFIESIVNPTLFVVKKL